MEESPLPFLPDAPARAAAADRPRRAAAGVAREAARLAAEVDRRLAGEQPPPDLPPITRPAPARPNTARAIPRPFLSVPVDPAGLAGARQREVRNVRPRVVECVACEFKKLDTRLGNPIEHGHDPRRAPPHPQHWGPGERDYTLCHTCHDANGKIHPKVYQGWIRLRDREGVQRTLRADPEFAEIAARVAAVERWRAGQGEPDLAGDLHRPGSEVGPGPAREIDGDYDGLPPDGRVMRLSDFTGQVGGEGRSRSGHADPEFSRGAPYDPAVVGADEVEAHIAHEGWEARRQENFRAAWDRTGDIEDPDLRHAARARLVERWDPRMVLSGDDQMVPANPFADPSPAIRPFARSASHTGVDEGFADASSWQRAALARHEAAVSAFVADVRVRLALQKVPAARIAEITALPDLNPGRELGKLERDTPLHKRIAAANPRGPRFLAPAADLDAVAREAVARGEVRDGVERVILEEAKRGRVDAPSFVAMAERIQRRDVLVRTARTADAAREEAHRWSGALQRADAEVRGATRIFGQEIHRTFRDPDAFQHAFSRLPAAEKRAVLQALRERPATFAREFARHGGSAGELAAAARGRPGAVSDGERSALLAAEAGTRYLDAVRLRDLTRANAARTLGLDEGARLKEVSAACTRRLRAADRLKTYALKGRDTLGPVPTPAELERAFKGLHQEDRRKVMKQVAGLNGLMTPQKPELARRGPSL